MILFYEEWKEPYGFMSNFYPSPFKACGLEWKNVECFFQAMKTLDAKEHLEFSKLPTPLAAKKKGRSMPLRADWEEVKVRVMTVALYCKFEQNPELLKKLLATNDKVLHEDSPSDFIWGWRNNGKDLLGKCLMEVREQLKPEKVLKIKNSKEKS